ncbi:uncharacterized protein [Hemitrygon akajei]|uniref:uncharacterized protein n=1 Tax=Hemitrygon akajei TaxID=2704970 RepID=UPI003BFA1AAD
MRNRVVLTWCITVCMSMVRSAPGQHYSCLFENSSYRCPCSLTANQFVRFHNLENSRGSFEDWCIRGEGDEVCCVNNSQAWMVDVHSFLKNFSHIPGTLICEMVPRNMSSRWKNMKCPRHNTRVTTLEPVPAWTNGSDGGDAPGTTKSVAGWTVGVIVAVVLVAGVIGLLICWFYRKNRTTGNGACSWGSTIWAYFRVSNI